VHAIYTPDAAGEASLFIFFEDGGEFFDIWLSKVLGAVNLNNMS
jgi:hypothetical protein